MTVRGLADLHPEKRAQVQRRFLFNRWLDDNLRARKNKEKQQAPVY